MYLVGRAVLLIGKPYDFWWRACLMGCFQIFIGKNFKVGLFFCQVRTYLCIRFWKRTFFRNDDLVAQPVEHLTFNQGVMGSNPIEITIIISELCGLFRVTRFFAHVLHTNVLQKLFFSKNYANGCPSPLLKKSFGIRPAIWKAISYTL